MHSSILQLFSVYMSYLLYTDITSAVSVKIHGVTFAIRGELINISCTTDSPPTSLTAQFIVGNVTYASLRLYNKDCYNGPRLCIPDICRCSEDSEGYVFRLITSTEQKNALHVACVMRFGTEKKTDSMKINIYEPPHLTLEIIGLCNGTSQIVMRCHLAWRSDNYGFSPWLHFLNGILVRNLTGTVQDNMSILRIDSCSNQDAGRYICNGWTNLSDKVFNVNKSSLIEYEEPPVIDRMFTFKLSLTITVFSVKFYTLFGSMSSNWYNGKLKIKNSTHYEVVAEGYPIDLIIYEKEITHQGCVSNLTVKDNTPGEYTLVLQNNYGEIRVPFPILEEKNLFGFQLHVVIWILIVVSVFVVTVVLTIFSMRYRDQHYASGSFVVNQQSRSRAIYYAAPSVNNQTHTYSTTEPHYTEAEDDENAGSFHQYEDIDDSDKDVHLYEISHQYLDLN